MQPVRSFARVDRSLLDGVLAVVRQLGATASLPETFDLILKGIVEVVGFDAAALNVTTPEGDLRVDAVNGPPGTGELLGTRRPMGAWLGLLDDAEPWGELRFYGHERPQEMMERYAYWRADRDADPDPGAWHPEDTLLAPLWGADGQLIGVIGVDEPRSGRRPDADQRMVLEVFASQAAKAIVDARVREQRERERRRAEDRWRLAFEHSPTGMALISARDGVQEVNDALVAMLRTSRERLLTTHWIEYTYPDDIEEDVRLFAELTANKRSGYQLEKRYIRGDGTTLWASLHVASVHNVDDPDDITVVAQVVDITERQLAADRLAHRRTHDPLTELYNRTGIAEEVTRLLAAGRHVGVLLGNVDRFTTVNSGLGREAGDETLAAVAARLAGAAPSPSIVGRVSGDEFAVLVPDAHSPEVLTAVGDSILAALENPIEVRGLRIRVGMTVGAAVSTPLHRHGDELMRDAELSLADAKRHARGAVEVYDPSTIRRPTRDDLELEQDLRAAVDTGAGLTVYLQPIVNLESSTVVGTESLLRWRHPERGVLLPDLILPIAEQSGLIVPLGARMLELGVSAAHAGYQGAQGWVAVNVSGSQLGRGLLPEAVAAALDTHDLGPEFLHLEITETALVNASPQAIREVHEIAEAGVSIALDDFGTGYSSLSLLRDLPISVVKIDRSFIAPIAEDRRAAALVRSLVVMCDSLGIGTVAEGVETVDQLAVVSALGCDHAQGYLFGRPIDAGSEFDLLA